MMSLQIAAIHPSALAPGQSAGALQTAQTNEGLGVGISCGALTPKIHILCYPKDSLVPGSCCCRETSGISDPGAAGADLKVTVTCAKPKQTSQAGQPQSQQLPCGCQRGAGGGCLGRPFLTSQHSLPPLQTPSTVASSQVTQEPGTPSHPLTAACPAASHSSWAQDSSISLSLPL